MADTNGEMLGRLLERTEAQGKLLEQVLTNGAARDDTMRRFATEQQVALQQVKHDITEELGRKVRDAVHDQLNAIQPVVNAIERRVNGIDAGLKALDERVDHLEEPMHRALAIRLRRRKLWIRTVSVASAVSVVVWAVIEPLWKAVAEPVAKLLAHKWLGGDAP